MSTSLKVIHQASELLNKRIRIHETETFITTWKVRFELEILGLLRILHRGTAAQRVPARPYIARPFLSPRWPCSAL